MTVPLPASNFDAPLVQIGDVYCTYTHVVSPSGTFALRSTTWLVNDLSRTTTAIPAYAIVLAVVFFLFCLLGLLFLLIKEERTEGYVQVTVQGPGFAHSTNVPVSSPAQVADVTSRVSYARSLVAAAQQGEV